MKSLYATHWSEKYIHANEITEQSYSFEQSSACLIFIRFHGTWNILTFYIKMFPREPSLFLHRQLNSKFHVFNAFLFCLVFCISSKFIRIMSSWNQVDNQLLYSGFSHNSLALWNLFPGPLLLEQNQRFSRLLLLDSSILFDWSEFK